MTITNSQCKSYGDKIKENIELFYNPRMDETQKLIDSEISAGRDPKSYTIQGGIAIINLELLLEKMKEMKELSKIKATEAENKCDAVSVPDWIGDVNKMNDMAMGIAMLPFIWLTGNMAAAHVDLGEIYHGKPFGGDDALIPKIRDDVLDFLQIHGDVRKFINDPFNSTADFFSDGFSGLSEWLRKPFG